MLQYEYECKCCLLAAHFVDKGRGNLDQSRRNKDSYTIHGYRAPVIYRTSYHRLRRLPTNSVCRRRSGWRRRRFTPRRAFGRHGDCRGGPAPRRRLLHQLREAQGRWRVLCLGALPLGVGVGVGVLQYD